MGAALGPDCHKKSKTRGKLTQFAPVFRKDNFLLYGLPEPIGIVKGRGLKKEPPKTVLARNRFTPKLY